MRSLESAAAAGELQHPLCDQRRDVDDGPAPHAQVDEEFRGCSREKVAHAAETLDACRATATHIRPHRDLMPPAKKVAVITGAAAGIGRASAHAFAEAGYRVVLVDRDRDGLQAQVGEFADAAGHVCDVSDPEQVANTFASIAEGDQRIDALHANAGSSTYASFAEISANEMRRQIDINLLGHLYCVRAALPLLTVPDSSAIVFTASVQGYVTLPGCVPYAAAKAGLMAAARALAVELGGLGIRVNSVSPGTIDTPMLRRDIAGMDQDQIDDFFEHVKQANALGRIGNAREVADVVVFLCSDRAAYITGEDVVVDGGYLRVKRF
jgi:NAD(P)-dependent dehydrogenase (short-subunit alcohol dehydrogenase family)